MPAIHPGPGRYKFIPGEEFDQPPYYGEVSPDGQEFERDDRPEYPYAWSEDGDFHRDSTGPLEPMIFGYVCFGSTYRHYAQRPGFPITVLDEGHCEPSA